MDDSRAGLVVDADDDDMFGCRFVSKLRAKK
jgi:hypothetical protein